MEASIDFTPKVRVEVEVDPKYEFGHTPPKQLAEIFMHMILSNDDLEKFFFSNPEAVRVRYYVDDQIRLEMENPREELKAKRFPEEHRTFFKKDLKKSLKELNDQVALLQESLAEIDFVEAEYHIILKSCWESEGEKNIDLKLKMPLREALIHAEKEFLKVNKRSDIQANYYVHMKVKGTHVYLPQEFWLNFIKSYRDENAKTKED